MSRPGTVAPSAPAPTPRPVGRAQGAVRGHLRGASSLDEQVQALAPREGQVVQRQTLHTTRGGADVVPSTDGGDYYCEHTLYATDAASEGSPSVLRDENDDAMVGFLHLPGTRDRPGAPDRHADTQEVTGLAIRGYYDAAVAQLPAGEPVRILVTGYAGFELGPADNPAGDFVTHQANIDAAVSEAFAASVEASSVTGPEATDGGSFMELIYELSDMNPLVIRAQLYPVDPRAIGGEADSIQDTMGEFGPHAVLSLGVAPSRDVYSVETQADTLDLHDHGYPTDPTEGRTNRSLVGAMRRGAAAHEGDAPMCPDPMVSEPGQGAAPMSTPG